MSAAATQVGYMPMPAGFPYRALFRHGRPRHQKYDEFWRKHPPMDISHRAKIFSAFDALAGFGDRIADKEVLYCGRRQLSEGEREELDRKLSVLRRLTRGGRAAQKDRPAVTVRYFSPCDDEDSFAYGTGGLYKTVSGVCRKVDGVTGLIEVGDTAVPVEEISEITGRLFDAMEFDMP